MSRGAGAPRATSSAQGAGRSFAFAPIHRRITPKQPTAVELRLPRETEQLPESSSVSPGKPAMKVLRIVMSAQSCQARMRSRLSAPLADAS